MKQLMNGLTESRTPQGVCVLRVHYTCDEDRDPAINPAWKEDERRKYTSQGGWDKEQEIIFSAGGGERLFADILMRYGSKIFIDPATSGFEIDPNWRTLSGFDWGKANPTAAVVAKVDFEGTIYLVGEYYQPGLSPKEHAPNLLRLNGFCGNEAYADPSIFFKTQAQSDGTFKALATMFEEEGISNLSSAPENNELLGMERILSHWMNLDEREPSLKIICPTGARDIPKPLYGVHNEGCPNLVWELRRTRRAELSATQLQSKNPTEKIVDKDNHLRDCLKYLALTLPEPTKVSVDMKKRELMKHYEEDPTSTFIQMQKLKHSETSVAPVYGGNVRQRMMQLRKQRH